MSYIRVIPRDLFNEANLLKCYGKIYINLETANIPDVELEHNGDAFNVEQDENSGNLSLSNVTLKVRGKAFQPYRPLNSRAAWPLYLVDENGEEIEVFEEDGSFTDEMFDFLRGVTS